MSETAAAMHLGAAGKASMPCEVCGEPFTPKRASWAKFCSTRCRNAHHGAQARIEKIQARAVDLYRALADLCRVEGPVGDQARAAIDGLKPPVDPKDLLKA